MTLPRPGCADQAPVLAGLNYPLLEGDPLTAQILDNNLVHDFTIVVLPVFWKCLLQGHNGDTLQAGVNLLVKLVPQKNFSIFT